MCGYSLIELTIVVGLIATTLSAITAPPLLTNLDDFRTARAARHLSARLQAARMEAVLRSADVALRFTATPGGYTYAVFQDGNGHGVRTRDIQRGADRQIQAPERLRDQFTGIDFGTLPGLPPIDPAGSPPGDDPIRLGRATFSHSAPWALRRPGVCTSAADARHSTRYASSESPVRRGC